MLVLTINHLLMLSAHLWTPAMSPPLWCSCCDSRQRSLFLQAWSWVGHLHAKKRSLTLPPWHRRVQVRANAELDLFLDQDFYPPISLSRSSCSGLWMEILVDFLQIDSSLQPYGLAISMENQYRRQFPWTSTVSNGAFAKPDQSHGTCQKTDSYHPLTKNILANTVPTTLFNNSLFDSTRVTIIIVACASFQSTEDRNWIGVTLSILKKSCLSWSPKFILAFSTPYSLNRTER